MAGAWTTLSLKDAGGTTRTMRVWDESGTGAGPFSFANTIADLTGGGSPAVKAASTAPVAGDQALVVAISPNGQLPAGQASAAGSNPVVIATSQKFSGQNQATPTDQFVVGAQFNTSPTTVTSGNVSPLQMDSAGNLLVNAKTPVSIAPSTTDVPVTPTVTASAYTAGFVLGGIMTFANILAAASFNGLLQSITAKFKGSAVTGNLEVAIFKASPSNGTYTDHAAPTWNAADMANLLGIYTLTTPNSKLGTMTIYNLDGIAKAIVGASQSLFAVVIVDGTPTPASTSDFTLELGVLPG